MTNKRKKHQIGGGESRVKSEFQDECDMNRILDRYAATGIAQGAKGSPIFADVSMMQDLKTSLDTVASIEGRMKELPRAARELFRKNPQEFADALSKVSTQEELVKLGILEAAPVKPVEPEPVAAVNAEPPPEGVS